MTQQEQSKYIEAFSKLLGVKEQEAVEYAQRKGLASLVSNASELLDTPAKKQRHQAFLELYRLSDMIKNPNPILNSSENASLFFRSIMSEVYDKEAFAVAIVNTKNRVVDHEIVSLGSINQTLVHPREVFRRAILNKASGIIVCHNHPSGEITPSTDDILLTKRLKEAGEILGIKVVDHLIINGLNSKEYYSFSANSALESAPVYSSKSMPQKSDKLSLKAKSPER